MEWLRNLKKELGSQCHGCLFVEGVEMGAGRGRVCWYRLEERECNDQVIEMPVPSNDVWLINSVFISKRSMMCGTPYVYMALVCVY